MKNLNNQINTKRIKNFEIIDYRFFWIFEGNGDFSQKHEETDYRRFIERNYESKSNRNF